MLRNFFVSLLRTIGRTYRKHLPYYTVKKCVLSFLMICFNWIIDLVWKPLIIGSNRLNSLYCLPLFTTDNFYPKLVFTNVLIKSSLLTNKRVNNGGING